MPVSIRAEDERGNLGNRIALMRGPLPVYIEDPVRRLHVISAEMADLKNSKQALGAEVISRFNDFAPPTLLAQASRINFSTRLFNLIVTNVPGPQIPLYVLGRELEEVFPVAFLPQNHAPRDRDHELQRQSRLRPAGRLRLDGGHRSPRRRDQRLAGRARGARPAKAPRRPERRAAGSAARLPSEDGLFSSSLFIVVPIAELYVIIQVGELIGVLPTLLLLLLDAVLGSWLLKHEGRSAWRRFNLALAERRIPGKEVADGFLDHPRRHPAGLAGLHHRHLRRPLPAPADPGYRAADAAPLHRRPLRRGRVPRCGRRRSGGFGGRAGAPERRDPLLRLRRRRRRGPGRRPRRAPAAARRELINPKPASQLVSAVAVEASVMRRGDANGRGGRRAAVAVAMLALALALGLVAIPPAASATAAGRPGTLDPTFGHHGVFFSAPTPTYSGNDIVAIARQSDGKLLVAGKREGVTSGSLGVLMRRLPDGSPDPSFGKGGSIRVPSPEAIALDPTGRILLGGASPSKCHPGAVVRRLRPDGSPDPTFGGRCGTPVPFGIDQITVEGDGSLLVGGIAELGGGTKALPNPQLRLARLGPDGALDPTFGENGVASRPDEASNEYVERVSFAVEPDGGIAVAIRGDVLRFTADGKLDTSFGSGGKADAGGAAAAIVALPDGRLAVAAREEGPCCSGVGQFVISRLMTNGSPDPSFGDGGRTKLAIGDADRPVAMASVPGEGLLVAGDIGEGECAIGPCDFTAALLRLGADGTLDPGFGEGGIAKFPLPPGEFPTSGRIAVGMATGPAGEAFVAANVEYGASYVFERESGGAPAAGFEGGRPLTWTTTLPSTAEPTSVGVLGNGRIVLSIFGNPLRHEVGQQLLTVKGDGRAVPSAEAGAAGFSPAPTLKKSIFASGKAIFWFAGGERHPQVVRALPRGEAKPTGEGASLPAGFGGAGMTADGRGGVYAFGAVRGHPGLAVAHVRADGRLDRGFGRGGAAIVSFGGGRAGANALTVDSRGRIVVVGWAGHAVATRLLPDGRLDRSFGRHGRVDLLGDDTNVTTVAAVGDDIVAGCRHETVNDSGASVLVRLDGHGRRVRSFGRGGVLVADISALPIEVLPSHGRVVLVTRVGKEGGVRLRAYDAAGRPAHGWGHGGETVARDDQDKRFNPIDAAVTRAGQIVVAGTAGAWYVGNQAEVLRFR